MTLQIIISAPRKVPDLYYYPRLGQSTAVDIYICAGQLKMRGSGSGVAVGGGGREAAGTLSPLWHRTCPLHTCTPLALVTNNTSYVYPQLNYTQPRCIQDLLIHQ